MYYTFDFIRDDGAINHIDVGAFDHDAAAALAARRALDSSKLSVCVRVWRNDILVAEAKVAATAASIGMG